MPASIVKSFAQKTGKPAKEVERLWSKAKEAAKENGRSEDSEDFYPYVTSILKKMLKVNEMNKTTKIFKEFALGSLSESVEVDTDTFVGVHGNKPKGHGSWIFFADKYKTDIRKDDYYQTPHAMNYGDAVKLAKKWAAEKKLFRIYVAS